MWLFTCDKCLMQHITICTFNKDCCAMSKAITTPNIMRSNGTKKMSQIFGHRLSLSNTIQNTISIYLDCPFFAILINHKLLCEQFKQTFKKFSDTWYSCLIFMETSSNLFQKTTVQELLTEKNYIMLVIVNFF